MIWSRIWASLVLLGLAALAVEPIIFMVLAVPAAAVWLIQTRHWIWWPWFVAYGLLGLLSQAFVPLPPTPPPMGLPAAGQNLIPPFGLSDLRGWHPSTSSGQRPEAGREPHDGSQIAFEMSFFTARGHQLRPVEIHALGNSIYRASAVYLAQEGDLWVRAPDLVGLQGDWTWLDIGFAQLEEGGRLSEYTPGGFPPASLLERMGWWLGTGLIGLVILLASQHIFRLLGPQPVAWAVLLGLLVSTLVGVQQHLGGVERVSGFSVNPNIYGAGGVVLAWLVVLLGGSYLRLGAGALSATVVFISASRAALLGWAALLLVLIWQSNRWVRGTALLGAGVFVLVWWLQPEWLGRIGASLSLDHHGNLSRVEIWQVAWQAFLQSPLAGIGIHNFGSYYQMNLPEYALDPYARHTHSLPLKLLAETGLLGLLGFWLLWGFILLWLVRQKAWLGMAFVGTVLGLNLVDYTFFTAEVYYALWLGLGWQVYRYSGEAR